MKTSLVLSLSRKQNFALFSWAINLQQLESRKKQKNTYHHHHHRGMANRKKPKTENPKIHLFCQRERSANTHTVNSLKKEEKANPFTEATKKQTRATLSQWSGNGLPERRRRKSISYANTHISADEKRKERRGY